MQRRLFGPNVEFVPAVSDAQMKCVLRDLRAAPELGFFRIWLVGSRVEPGRHGSDIDIVLSPRAGTLPSELLIERALWCCREYGLYGATPACVIDPCFRAAGPTVGVVPLRPRVEIKTVKLFSPRLAHLMWRGRIRKCRRMGHVSLDFVRRAEDTDYYGKLPRGDFGKSRWPYLRPAIEIPCADGGDLLHAIQGRVQVAGDGGEEVGKAAPVRVDGPRQAGSWPKWMAESDTGSRLIIVLRDEGPTKSGVYPIRNRNTR